MVQKIARLFRKDFGFLTTLFQTTAWKRISHDHLIVVQLVETFHMFFGKRNSITVFLQALRSQENSVHTLKTILFNIEFCVPA